MTDYTKDAHALPYPEGQDKVAVAADLRALAVKTGASITQEGARVEGIVREYATTNAKHLAELQAALDGADLITNGAFRDGLAGWSNVGSWRIETNGVTTWARATTGADGALNQPVALPGYLLGKSLRLVVTAWTTSAGELFLRGRGIPGTPLVRHPLTLEPREYSLDLPIPASQGATPLIIDTGRSAGNVYMSAVRLEEI